MTIRSRPSTPEFRENYERIFERPRRELAEREREAVRRLDEATSSAVERFSRPPGRYQQGYDLAFGKDRTIHVVEHPAMPDSEAEIRGADGEVVRVVNIAPPDPADDPDATDS